MAYLGSPSEGALTLADFLPASLRVVVVHLGAVVAHGGLVRQPAHVPLKIRER